MFQLRALAFALVFAGVFLAPARAQNRPIETEIRVEGATQLKPLLESVSDAVRLKDQGAPSVGAVKRIAAKDAERFQQALSSQGYYNSRIAADAVETERGFKANFEVETGAYYRVTSHVLRYTDEGRTTARRRPPTQARPSTIPAAASTSSPSSGISSPACKRTATLGALSTTSPRSRKGRALRVSLTSSKAAARRNSARPRKGLKRTRADYLGGFAAWRPGEIYNADQANEMRDEIAATGLFTRVEVKAGDIDPEGNAPVMVELTERRPRTVSAGLSYSTNLGPGIAASWVHRNVLGRAEKLTADVSFAKVKQLSSLTFEKPRIARRTDFISKLSAVHQDDDVFRGKLITLSAGVSHRFGKSLVTSVGAEYTSSITVDAFGSRRSNIVGFPLGATWTNIKDLLDPKRGLSVALTVTPNAGASNGPIFFTTTDFTSRYHWPIDKGDRFIGALWTHVGASLGPNTSSIPPEKRFYAGGAGSVRGYAYHELGPTDGAGKPIGGRSVLEGGVEFRFPVVRKIGGAVFLEAGGVDETGLFTFAEGIRESAGVGVRYQTPIGPVRLDIAVPLARRHGRDDPVQVYVGLGQAF
ncbi:MAG: BamA/TamA family outer membrane protein [Alphaproteobacteria bacterium]